MTRFESLFTNQLTLSFVINKLTLIIEGERDWGLASTAAWGSIRPWLNLAKLY